MMLPRAPIVLLTALLSACAAGSSGGPRPSGPTAPPPSNASAPIPTATAEPAPTGVGSAAPVAPEAPKGGLRAELVFPRGEYAVTESRIPNPKPRSSGQAEGGGISRAPGWDGVIRVTNGTAAEVVLEIPGGPAWVGTITDAANPKLTAKVQGAGRAARTIRIAAGATENIPLEDLNVPANGNHTWQLELTLQTKPPLPAVGKFSSVVNEAW